MNKSFITPLKDLCNNFKEDIVDGPFGANLKREHYQLEGIPVLKIQNIKPFHITLKKMDYVTEEKYLELKRHSYSDGDIIMTKLGNPLGESAIVEDVDDGLIVADLVRVRAQKVDTRYLCYHLNSPVTIAYINSQQKGTTRPRVRISVVRDLPIYTPSISEQKRIVTLLDTVFSDLEQTRAKTEQNLKNARELFDSYLQQVFSQKGEGWVESKLGDLLHISSSKRVYAKDWTDSGVPFFGGKEIVKLAKYGKAVSNAFISEEKYMDYASKYDMPQEGDILMTARGTIGVGYIVKEGDKFYYKDGNIISLRQKSPTNPDFILYAFKSRKITDQIKELTGTTVSHLPLNKAKELIINIPSYQAQNKLVLKIKEIEGNIQQVISIYEEKLTSIDELKKSILQKAFSGELTTSAK